MLELEQGIGDRSAEKIPVNRRTFLKALGGGVLVIFSANDATLAQESGRGGGRGSRLLPQNIGAWLHIAPSGTVTVFTGKTEVGQNIRTSLTQAVADELHCAPASIKLVMADTAVTPFDMGTFGSRTTPAMAPQLRKMAATARELLLDAASKKWGSARTSLTVVDGQVLDRSSKKKIGIGELAQTVNLSSTIGEETAVTPASDWKVAGKTLQKVNAQDIVTGKHEFPPDIKRDGILYGRVLRPPSFDAALVSVNTEGAAQVAGVTVIHEGDFVGVVASNEHTAQQALQKIKAEWKHKTQISNAELFSYLKANTSESGESRRRSGTEKGSIEKGLQEASKTLRGTYTVSYIAHVPLEPRAAVAEWKGAKLTVWTGTQRPFGVRSELAQAFGTPEENIRVVVPDTGSGYGGKHTGECAVEAARLAKSAGKPVKLLWTREEEFSWAYFRPAGVIDVSSGAKKDGLISAWEFHNYNSGPSGLDTPYEVANQAVRFHSTKYPLRQGSYRGLASTANHFARESHMDEMAAAVGIDPLAFRLQNLKDERIRAVLQAAAERFGWGKTKPKAGHGFGLACGTEKGGYVACCVEVSVGAGPSVKIERIVEAFECGAVVNPEQLKNQIEGGIVMGIGGALFEAIDFADGRILNGRLSKYRVPRFGDVPEIDVILVDRKDLPSAGAGEAPIVGIAPAIANAIYHAKGIRVRSMPILSTLKV